jgi:hypothetical protein
MLDEGLTEAEECHYCEIRCQDKTQRPSEYSDAGDRNSMSSPYVMTLIIVQFHGIWPMRCQNMKGQLRVSIWI